MGIERFEFLVVLDFNGDAIGTMATGNFNNTSTCGANWGSIGYAEINTGVHFGVAEEWVLTHAKAGGDFGAGNRSFQKGLGGAPAILIEVINLAIGPPNKASTLKVSSNTIRPKSGNPRKYLFVTGILVFVSIVIAAALIYFLIYYRAVDTGTF